MCFLPGGHDMNVPHKKLRSSAIFGALVASSFIVAEIVIICLIVVNVFLSGIVQDIAYGICFLAISWFWVRFYRHVYHVELNLLSDSPPDEPS